VLIAGRRGLVSQQFPPIYGQFVLVFLKELNDKTPALIFG
jgi:hypothetical protein